MDYIPLNAVRAFEAAARHLSFSAAGEELHVTHPAISHQIRRLEEWLGVSLFHRDARKVRLTEAGVILQASASGALAELGATCRRIRRNAAVETLSVGCIPSIASRWLVPRLSDFTARHPGVGMRVAYAKADERLGDGQNDVLITLGAVQRGIEYADQDHVAGRVRTQIVLVMFVEHIDRARLDSVHLAGHVFDLARAGDAVAGLEMPLVVQA